MKPICARDASGRWCAAVGDATESDLTVKTLCDEAIVLPHGVTRRIPTCTKCRDALEKERGDE